MGSMFALIIGSNFGANFTLVGALAGLMWHSILKDFKITSITHTTFMKNGFLVMPLVVFNTFSVLYAEFIIIYFEELKHKIMNDNYILP